MVKEMGRRVKRRKEGYSVCSSHPPLTQNEQLQRTNWQLVDENHRLNVRLMEDDKSSFLSRHLGDRESEEISAHSSYASKRGFQRNTQLRQTYHSGEAPRNLVPKLPFS